MSVPTLPPDLPVPPPEPLSLGAALSASPSASPPVAPLPTAPSVASPTAPSVLADHEIRAAIAAGDLRVDPHDPSGPDQQYVRPAALSLRLGTKALVLEATGPVDTAVAESYPRPRPRPADRYGRIVVHPGEVVLAPTLEQLVLPDTLVGILDGISDVARLGMSVVLAQQVSPGFGRPDGAVLTLEIVSRLSTPVYLHAGMRICNLLLLRCAQPTRGYADMPHNHSSDRDAEPSRLAHFVRAGMPLHTGQTVAIDPGP
jgi:dCTP deaminase